MNYAQVTAICLVQAIVEEVHGWPISAADKRRFTLLLKELQRHSGVDTTEIQKMVHDYRMCAADIALALSHLVPEQSYFEGQRILYKMREFLIVQVGKEGYVAVPIVNEAYTPEAMLVSFTWEDEKDMMPTRVPDIGHVMRAEKDH